MSDNSPSFLNQGDTILPAFRGEIEHQKVPPLSHSQIFFQDQELVRLTARKIPLVDLACFCLVSSKLFKTAAPILWEIIPTSLCLLSLLPGFSCVDGRWNLLRDHDANELRRFYFYSAFVTQIIHPFSSNPYRSSDLNPSIFDRLQAVLPDRPLFPNLRICIEPPLPDRIIYLDSPFFSASLRQLSCTVLLGMDERVAEVLTRAQLTKLAFTGYISPDSLIRIGRLCHLSELDLQFSKRIAFFNVAEGITNTLTLVLGNSAFLQHVTSLSLSLPRFISIGQLPLSSLANLRRLAIVARTDTINAILMATSNLVCASIHATNRNLHSLCDSVDILAHHCPTTLRSVTLKTNTLIRFRSLVSPLLAVRNVRRLAIMTRYPVIEVRDSDFLAVANAWPLLEVLDLPSKSSTEQLTVISLHHLARLNHLRSFRFVLAGQVVSLPWTHLGLSEDLRDYMADLFPQEHVRRDF
ncbi:hypothetical protein NLJ89_g3529 [Agrocybe chaxingu]|uniref:Uncharacterized protein n=1 Tax=Agrocybe chaxingu TaxID=84603 RepID=A0A9W8KAX7_9AGAR|nr:hypothetical protein NLJ89_g3529 [Agrocybe chaxingu]